MSINGGQSGADDMVGSNGMCSDQFWDVRYEPTTLCARVKDG